ncbi:MAG: dTMP kinase [Candidatus Thermoplasmatota archaeon]|nr:dTMP kinase [Candidatus Thermoplasmatota archaeon]
MANFIVLEGIDGSGKSSVARFFREKHEEVFLTKEPTDLPVGRLVQRSAHEETSPFRDLFLYLADRVDHTENIKTKLDEGFTVICDRYWGSTAAYQAAYEMIELDYAENIQMPFILNPDLTILFDIDPEISLERITHRENRTKYEREDFLDKVRDNYLCLAKKHDWKIIDAKQSQKDVLLEVKELIYKETEGIE